MKKTNVRTIAAITIFAVIIVFTLGSFAFFRSAKYIKAEINEKIGKTTEDYASDFSESLNHMVGLTDSLTAYVDITLDKKAFSSGDTAYIAEYREQLARYIRNSLETSENAHSLYVTFNPQLTEEPEEVWYVIRDGKLERIYADLKKREADFELPYDDNMAYYFKPQDAEEEYAWTGLYYDKDLKENMFSYSRAIYIDETFIGVAGADVTADSTVEIIRNMNLYENGNSVLYDENDKCIVASEGLDEKEIRQLAEDLAPRGGAAHQEVSGVVSFMLEGLPQIVGFAGMENGWTLVTVQPEAEAYAPVRNLTTIMILLGVLMGLALTVFMFLLTRPFVQRTDSLERENRAKDILLADQSRQARIGEMFGNITHQWKQPLNTIRLIMANLLDSYHYDDLDEARLQNSVHKVDQIIDNMTETIRDFSEFLKPSKERSVFDIRDCIRSAISLMEESLNRHRIRVNVSCKGRTSAYGYPNEMTHAIFNILNNARDAILEDPSAQREIDVIVSTEGRERVISVFNDGKPLTEEAQSKAGEPYFTTKAESGGTGLGLYITRQIIEEHMGGRLTLRNTADRICTRIIIPVEGEEDTDER